MSSDSSSLEQVKGDILFQVKGLFDSFAASLEARFTSIDNKVSEVASSRDLPIASAAHQSEPDGIRDVSVQDVANSNNSFSAPTVVARRFDPVPDVVPSAPYPDGLGTYSGGPVATNALSNATSLTHICFVDLLATIRVLEVSGRVPDAFLESLRGSIQCIQ